MDMNASIFDYESHGTAVGNLRAIRSAKIGEEPEVNSRIGGVYG